MGHYTVLTYNKPAYQGNIVRVRMARSVCLEIWDSCKDFSVAVASLKAALADSAIARSAPLAIENMDMFLGQQQLCDWMHDQVALHPFRLESGEDSDIPVVAKPVPRGMAVPHARSSALGAMPSRRLGLESELNVLAEGRATKFDLVWRSPDPGTSFATSLRGSSVFVLLIFATASAICF